jgi:hypothetical protein
MNQEQLLPLALSKPEPEMLWQLRNLMLESGLQRDDARLQIVDEFYYFVINLVASSTAREYSHFASLLDLGAVGGVALQNLFDSQGADNFTQRIMAGALSEVLMVVAARQYVKAWEEEMKAVYLDAAWKLYEGFWHVSRISQPDLDPAQRTTLVQNLIDPLLNEELKGTVKAALIVHYYQLLLTAWLNNPDE